MSDVATKPGKSVVQSVYVTGWCGSGNHENTKNLSSSGQVMRACPMGGRYDAGRLGEIICTCNCHESSRAMEDMSGIKLPATIINRQTPSLGRLLRAPGIGTGADGSAVSGDPSRSTVAVASGAVFVATPTGRAARGQLEEQVRHAISVQVKMAGEEMIAMLGLNPSTLAAMIDKDNPPSTGAIYSVLKRWEGQALVDLGQSPFRFLRFTDRGKRDLLR
jgi:hypothetical protein